MKKISKKIVVLKEKGSEFERQVVEKTFGYIVTSFGLVAGLAWNDAIKSLIETYFPMQNDTVKAKFVYASVITVVVVFISLYLARLFKKESNQADKEKDKVTETKILKKKTAEAEA